VIFDHPTPSALADHLDEELASRANTFGNDQPDLMARFNDVARELQTLLDRPGWKPEDKMRLSARIQTMLTSVTTPPETTYPDDSFDDDINTATESQLFALLEEDGGL
jgi:polyketide synthase 7